MEIYLPSVQIPEKSPFLSQFPSGSSACRQVRQARCSCRPATSAPNVTRPPGLLRSRVVPDAVISGVGPPYSSATPPAAAAESRVGGRISRSRGITITVTISMRRKSSR